MDREGSEQGLNEGLNETWLLRKIVDNFRMIEYNLCELF